jgi:hypothetical protein
MTTTHSLHDTQPRLARLREVAADGSLWLDDGRPARVLAQVPLADLRRAHAEGLPVLVADADGPVVLGTVLGRAEEHADLRAAPDGSAVLTAARRLVLACGAAAIAIHADGTVSISGVDVRSQARRLQRITGGQVRIN